jgi:hypothetical protein
MALKVYDPNQVSVIVGTINIEEGWDDGEFLTIEYDENAFETVVSTDGMVTRSKTNNAVATITVKLIQSSPSNDALSALHNVDLITNNGAGVVPLFINDKSGRSKYTALECWVEKFADVAFDREATGREWTLKAAKLITFTGGN